MGAYIERDNTLCWRKVWAYADMTLIKVIFSWIAQETYKILAEQVVVVLCRFSMRYFKRAISNLKIIQEQRMFGNIYIWKSSVFLKLPKILPPKISHYMVHTYLWYPLFLTHNVNLDKKIGVWITLVSLCNFFISIVHTYLNNHYGSRRAVVSCEAKKKKHACA